ncbi:hypothetical protein CCACVL1_02302 [Corchorus capsularis]|uniref:Uncharacterized protein n=1 Tax=Corchorus capsularis TaxID=210143 RepID=A0A1R3K9F4_COCAP|nr:hypothetical protein CCACVL1_02302 [Corchorus capsularis]
MASRKTCQIGYCLQFDALFVVEVVMMQANDALKVLKKRLGN